MYSLIRKLNQVTKSGLFHSKLYHVRPVTQGDVIRADAKDIPRIFQILYAGEGAQNRADADDNSPAAGVSASF